MAMPKKITVKEFEGYVDQQMVSRRITEVERNAIKSAFSSDLKDVDIEERRPFMGKPALGVTEKEVVERMAELRDPHSVISKNSKARLYEHPARLDEIEKILREALEGDKESRWF